MLLVTGRVTADNVMCLCCVVRWLRLFTPVILYLKIGHISVNVQASHIKVHIVF